MKKFVSSLFSGLQIGSFIYLLVLLFDIQKSPVTKGNIISILIMSACIGALRLIFDSERFSFIKLLIIHCLITLSIVSLMMIYNGWSHVLLSPAFWFEFVLIYFIIWLLVRLDIYLKTQKMNEALSKRHKRE